MKEKGYIYAGESVVLRFEARKEGLPVDLSNYDVQIEISTTAMGIHLTKLSIDGSVDVSQAARGMLLCPLSAEETGALTPGTATIGVRLLRDKFVRIGFDASIEVLRQGTAASPILSRTAQPIIALHTPCIWVYMDFAATRGDDGKTPYIGENGNWFIGNEDTGERALGVTYDDLTPEQIAELQRPATEAATIATTAAEGANAAAKRAATATTAASNAAADASGAAGTANAAAERAATATTAASNAAADASGAAGTANAAAERAATATTAASNAAADASGAAVAANAAAERAATATTTASNAATTASDAAVAANAAAGRAATATTTASNAADDASGAAVAANAAAERAATATTTASNAAMTASDAAVAANAAAERATTATTAANNAVTASTTATNNAIAAASEANNAAAAANAAAEGINGKIDNKADLDPETGYIVSSQIEPISPSGSPLHDLFVGKGAVWNANTGYWELNGLTDITTEQMIDIYNMNTPFVLGVGYPAFDYPTHLGRTTFPIVSVFSLYSIYFDSTWNHTTEVLRLSTYSPQQNSTIQLGQPFQLRYFTELKRIVDILDIQTTAAIISFEGCDKLEEVRIKNIRRNTNLSTNGALNLDSLEYLIENAANTSGITVTVHAGVYAKLTDPSNTEWYAVNESAQAKQISFATA